MNPKPTPCLIHDHVRAMHFFESRGVKYGLCYTCNRRLEIEAETSIQGRIDRAVRKLLDKPKNVETVT